MIRLLGRCTNCRCLLTDAHPHQWADPATRRPLWPLQHGSCLYCQACATTARGAA